MKDQHFANMADNGGGGSAKTTQGSAQSVKIIHIRCSKV